MKKFSIILILLFLICGCNKESSNLNIAEKIYCNYPDSALNILREINPNDLSENQRIKYNILNGLALYFFNLTIDPTQETGDIYNWLSNGKDDDFNMKAWFLLGNIYNEKCAADSAMFCALKCEKISEIRQDLMWQGRANVLKSDILVKIFNYRESAASLLKAASLFKKAGSDAHVKYNATGAAYDLINIGENEKAQCILDSVWSQNPDSTYGFSEYKMRAYALLHGAKNEFEKAKLYLDSIPQEIWANEDFQKAMDWMIVYNGLGNDTKVDEIIENVRLNYPDSMLISEPQYFLNSYIVYKKRGDYKTSLEFYEKYADAASNILQETLAGNGLRYENEFLEKEKQEAEAHARTTKNYLLAGITLLLIALLALSLIYSRRRKQQRLETEELKSTIKNLSTKIDDLEDEIENGSKTKIYEHKLKKALKSMAFTLAHNCSEKEKESLKKEIKDIFSDNLLDEITAKTRKRFPGLLEGFEENFPRFAEKDIPFIVLFLAGFDSASVGLILGLRTNSVYQRRIRLRERLESSLWPRAKELSEMLV